MTNSRRIFCQNLVALAALGSLPAGADSGPPKNQLLRKKIPGTDQYLPCVGMGSWITFDVHQDSGLWNQRVEVLRQFYKLGGSVIDSSPMYGHAEALIGYCLKKLSRPPNTFAASKIWTPVEILRGSQMSNTESLWGIRQMNLMFVHNLVAWRKHLPIMREWKANGRVRYIGVSTSHGRRHQELEEIMRSEVIDFIQLTLNIDQIEAEKRLLPLAADRGIAVMINRPFRRGALFDKYQSRPLPGIAKELGCQHWAQFFLLYILSHPAVTCAIPATSNVLHMQENMRTLALPLPEPNIRQAMRRSLRV